MGMGGLSIALVAFLFTVLGALVVFSLIKWIAKK